MNHQQIAELAKHTCLFICNDDFKNLFVGELEDVLYKDNADFIPVLAKVITTKRSTAEFQEVPEGVDPRLYPAGADFDLDFFTETINNKESLTVFRFTLSNYLKINILHTVLDGLTPAISNAKSFLNYLDQLWLAVPDEIADNDELTNFVIKELDKRNLLDDMTLLPAILRAMYEGLDEIPEGFVIDHKHDAECNEIIQAANKEGLQIPAVKVRKLEKFLFPKTKIDNSIWTAKGDADEEGKFYFELNTSSGKKGKGALICVTLLVSALKELSLEEKLTPFDRLVYNAICTFADKNIYIFSVNSLAREMGFEKPSQAQIRKINESLTKMRNITIVIDNTLEVNAYKGKYDKIVIDATILSFVRKTAYINGKQVKNAIYLLNEPPLLAIAKQRGQITQFPQKLLEIDRDKRDYFLATLFYIVNQISWMKNDKRAPRKISYNALNNECNIMQKDTKRRNPEKIKSILDFYKDNGDIKDYEAEEDGVKIIL